MAVGNIKTHHVNWIDLDEETMGSDSYGLSTYLLGFDEMRNINETMLSVKKMINNKSDDLGVSLNYEDQNGKIETLFGGRGQLTSYNTQYHANFLGYIDTPFNNSINPAKNEMNGITPPEFTSGTFAERMFNLYAVSSKEGLEILKEKDILSILSKSNITEDEYMVLAEYYCSISDPSEVQNFIIAAMDHETNPVTGVETYTVGTKLEQIQEASIGYLQNLLMAESAIFSHNNYQEYLNSLGENDIALTESEFVAAIDQAKDLLNKKIKMALQNTTILGEINTIGTFYDHKDYKGLSGPIELTKNESGYIALEYVKQPPSIDGRGGMDAKTGNKKIYDVATGEGAKDQQIERYNKIVGKTTSVNKYGQKYMEKKFMSTVWDTVKEIGGYTSVQMAAIKQFYDITQTAWNNTVITLNAQNMRNVDDLNKFVSLFGLRSTVVETPGDSILGFNSETEYATAFYSGPDTSIYVDNLNSFLSQEKTSIEREAVRNKLESAIGSGEITMDTFTEHADDIASLIKNMSEAELAIFTSALKGDSYNHSSSYE